MGEKQNRFMDRLPLFQGLRPFQWSAVSKNLLAGLTLAAMNIPQSLGYTKIAGTPIVTGLYTLLFPLVAFALFGSSRFLVVAADSATAAILAGGLAGLAPIEPRWGHLLRSGAQQKQANGILLFDSDANRTL